MLIDLTIRNFASFRDETRFLMTNVKSFKEFEPDNLIKTEREFDLLKSAVIFGANSSGKSNFIVSLSNMTRIIHESYRNALQKKTDKEINDFQFKLNTETVKQNTSFEFSLLIDHSIYRYGFEIYEDIIKKEWLFRKNERENILFERENDKFKINQRSFKEGNKYKDEVNENVLLLSILVQNNQPVSKKIFETIKNINIISGINEEYHKRYTTFLLKKDSNFKKWISSVLKYLEISSIEAGEDEGEIYTYHKRYDENNLLVDTVPFSLSKEESEGTKKLVYLLGPIYDTLKNGKILFIDEFDSRLHPNLTKKLVSLFHKYNLNNAQFVFSGIDTNLLSKEIFRRDQIWFVAKNQFAVSELYSLSEFNSDVVRNSSAIDKKYLHNKFGAAETLKIDKNIIDLLNAS